MRHLRPGKDCSLFFKSEERKDIEEEGGRWAREREAEGGPVKSVHGRDRCAEPPFFCIPFYIRIYSSVSFSIFIFVFIYNFSIVSFCPTHLTELTGAT